MDIAPGVQISMSARLDKTNPKGIHIGENSVITFDVVILTHDFVNNVHKDVFIGRNCLIGARSIIFPGVTIGDECIISAASVVVKDVPSNTMVAGNPARVVQADIRTGPWGLKIKDPA